MSAARSSLDTTSWATDLAWLGLWIVPSVLGHLLIVGVIAGLSALPSCREEAPIEDVIEVSLVVMPKSTGRMATMDVRTPSDAPPVPDPEPTTAPDPEPAASAPAPPQVSDLVVRDERTDPTPSDRPAPDADQERRDAERRDMLRRLAVQSLDAPVGDVASQATDPDGTSDERINLGGSGPVADPELARYVQRVRDLFMARFNPLQTVAQQNPKIVCALRVRFDMDTGRVTSWEWIRRSGNPSWDGAAERAVEAVPTVPLPPEKHRDRFVSGYIVQFDASSL